MNFKMLFMFICILWLLIKQAYFDSLIKWLFDTITIIKIRLYKLQ